MITRVKIADIGIRRENGQLVTVGLGSCVGISFYDSNLRLAGLAHILLADSSQFKDRQKNLMKYADTAIPLMLEKMQKQGTLKKRITAKISGGSQLFNFTLAGGSGLSVGEKNIAAVRKTLKSMGIPIRAEDVGGNFGRTMRVYVDTGVVEITSLQGYKKEL